MDELLIKQPFWEKLNEQQQKELAQNSRIMHCEAGELIYTPARECLGIMLVKQGVLRTYMVSDEGKKVTIFRLRAGDVCVLSMSCLLESITFDVEVEAEVESELLLIPVNTYDTVARDNMYLENFVYRTINEQFSDVVNAMQQMMFMTLEQRVCTFVIDELSVHTPEDKRIMVTHAQLAENIGSAREAVTRILKQMEKKGLILLFRGGLQVVDQPGLYAILN